MNWGAPTSAVRGNDWPSLPVAPLESFEPRLRVSVVVPYFEAPEALSLTLAALEGQTYPADLFEVVIVDDGSRRPLSEPADTPLRVRVVHQEDRGFGLARARNNGARAARGEIVVFLDCDMMPEAGWLAEHARWHHAACDVLTLGFRKHVDVEGIIPDHVRDRPGSLRDLFKDRPVESPQWIERRMTRTEDLTSGADDIFRVVTGGNFGVSADFFHTVGGFDETFTQWGSEDVEFGYRAFTLGAVLAPNRRALCWHQGPGATLSESEKASLAQQAVKISHLIADRRLRNASPGRFFTVPEHVVTVETDHASAEETHSTVEQILANEIHDLVVWIERHSHAAFDSLAGHLGPDPRVLFGAFGGACEAYPASPFHIRVKAGAAVGPDMVAELRRKLQSAASGWAVLASGHRVSITRAWALNRARRYGVEIADVGEVVDLDRAQADAERALRTRSANPTQTDTTQTDTEAADLNAAVESEGAPPDPGQPPNPRPLQPGSTPAAPPPAEAARLPARTAPPPALNVQPPSAWSRLRRLSAILFHRVRRIRSPGDAWRLARQVAGALKRRARARRHSTNAMPQRAWANLIGGLRLGRLRLGKLILGKLILSITPESPKPKLPRSPKPKKPKSPKPEKPAPPPLAGYPLGAEIAALGRRADVFAASSRVARSIGEDHIDLVVIDTARTLKALHGAVRPGPAPAAAGLQKVQPQPGGLPKVQPRAAVLSEMHPRLAVQAFDPELVNPIGWSNEHTPGGTRLKSWVQVSSGEVSSLKINSTLLQDLKPMKDLRRFHHVRDSAAYHDHTLLRAGTLAALAATGLPIRIADRNPNPLLRRCLGADLFDLMAGDRIRRADSHEREQLSIAMRRLALKEHSLRARARQHLTAAGIPAALPAVSVLLPTRRPGRLFTAIEAVSRQTYPRLELVLALHGHGFDTDAEILCRANCLGFPVQIVRVDAAHPLGAVLNAAFAASSGRLLTKFDDDDYYGSEHVWDLVLAHEYAQAELVAKAAEYVYLSELGKTIREQKRQEQTESYIRYAGVSGGVLMISRHALSTVGGWRRVPRSVDIALAQDVKKLEGRIYWTHGSGYMRVRHTGRHTWVMPDSHFMGRASEMRDGCDFGFAGIDADE